MIITVLAVGKTKKKFVQDGIIEYTKRLNKYARVKWLFVDPVTSANVESRVQKESELLAIQLKNIDGYTILLDKIGKLQSSEEFALTLSKTQKTGKITLVIGGSDGFDITIIPHDFVVSLSKMTFEHDLVRLVLFEQLYRAYSILEGGKYHK